MKKIHIGYVTDKSDLDVVFDDASLGWVALNDGNGNTYNLTAQQAEEIGIFFATAATLVKHGIGADLQ